MLDADLSLEFLRVVEEAAIACAHTMGQGDRHKSDHAAVEAMRRVMDSVPIDGTIVIGEGERDEAPMLYIGEKVGKGDAADPEVDIALDPLEGTTITATGGPNALSVIAMSDKGNLLNAPDTYMDKIAVGAVARGAIDITKPPTWNLHAVAEAKRARVEDLTSSSSTGLDMTSSSPISARRARESASSATATCRPASRPPSSEPVCTPSWAPGVRPRAS